MPHPSRAADVVAKLPEHRSRRLGLRRRKQPAEAGSADPWET